MAGEGEHDYADDGARHPGTEERNAAPGYLSRHD